MIKEINKKLFENQLGDIPLLIIDEEGKIIAANKISRRMFPIISNDISFYDMFGNLISQNIRKSIFESGIQNRIFKASYKIEKAVDEDIEYQITVSPFNSHDEIQYFVTLIPLKDKYHQQNVYIYKSDLDDIIQDVDLRNIIGKIKSSFPFTFIGKVKVSNEVDTIGFPIWVKDANRKFVLSNNKFASTQELNNNEIEGRIGEDFQTEISKQLYDDVDAFIKDTANSVVIEKYYAQQTQGKYGIKISAESPIYDLDQNVIGYIGFTKYMDEKDLESDNPVAIKYINSTKKEAQVEMDDILLQTSPEPIFIYETDNLKFVEVNDVALKLYGYKREEFLQMDLTDLYAPEDIQTLIESSTDKSTTGSFSGPWRHKTKPGKSILVEISKSSVTFRGKEVNINVVRDVTEKLEMEKKLKSYKATFDNSNDLIFLVDKSGFITHSNDRVKVELGYSKSDLEQKQFLSIVSDEDRANLNSMILQSSKKEATTLDVGIKK
ncbi:MAG: PAS domain S-box protein, partial [Melioribacteraceae bacterium]|nr:PAS domain S-box protein [Melioribacteraceae bacterium]